MKPTNHKRTRQTPNKVWGSGYNLTHEFPYKENYENLLNAIVTRYLEDARLSQSRLKASTKEVREKGEQMQRELKEGTFYKNPLLQYYDIDIINIIKKEAEKYVINYQETNEQ